MNIKQVKVKKYEPLMDGRSKKTIWE